MPPFLVQMQNRIGRIAKANKIKQFVLKVLHFVYEALKRPKRPRMALGTLLGTLLGSSSGVPGDYGALLGRSWGGPGDPPGLRHSLKRFQESPWVLFNYHVIQARLLHTAIGSYVRLSSSPSSSSCLPALLITKS